MRRDIDKENRIYKILYCILRPFIKILFRPVDVGFENLPEGAAIICANHSDGWDPFVFIFCVGKNDNVRFMVKNEFEKWPFVGYILNKLGYVFVDRKANDISAIKKTLFYLKSGEKIFIFPEGTRTKSDGSVDPKKGALKIAAKVKCPIVPVFIPRTKKLFSSLRIVMGTPYRIVAKTQDEFALEAIKLMEKIFSLSEEK